MKRLMSLLAVCLISTNVGCALCSSCDDYSYGAFGGLWERSDPTYGRVGSAFAPQGMLAVTNEFNEAEVIEPGQPGESGQPGEYEPESTEPPANGAAPALGGEEDSLLAT